MVHLLNLALQLRKKNNSILMTLNFEENKLLKSRIETSEEFRYEIFLSLQHGQFKNFREGKREKSSKENTMKYEENTRKLSCSHKHKVD
jgi:hypothetical protein